MVAAGTTARCALARAGELRRVQPQTVSTEMVEMTAIGTVVTGAVMVALVKITSPSRSRGRSPSEPARMGWRLPALRRPRRSCHGSRDPRCSSGLSKPSGGRWRPSRRAGAGGVTGFRPWTPSSRHWAALRADLGSVPGLGKPAGAGRDARFYGLFQAISFKMVRLKTTRNPFVGDGLGCVLGRRVLVNVGLIS